VPAPLATVGGHPDVDLCPNGAGFGSGQAFVTYEVLDVAVGATADMEFPQLVTEFLGNSVDLFCVRVGRAKVASAHRTK